MSSICGSIILERQSRIWDLWRQARPMSLIAADIEKPPSPVFSYLFYYGGIEPCTRFSRPDEYLSMSENSYHVVWLSGTV